MHSILSTKTNPWKTARKLLLVLLLLIAAGCGQTNNSGQDTNEEQKSYFEEGTNMSQGHYASKTQSPPIDRLVPEKLETATFALGWFWGPDAQFGQIEGLVRTRVGYAGGKKENPTYSQMGDHTETLQVDYDPLYISYEDLLKIYWNSHNPFRQTMSRQYMNIIFVHNEEQGRLARESKEALTQKQKNTVYTNITSFSKFYLAEDYHQKYYLQNVPALMKEFKEFYTNSQDFIDSTAAARVNGYINGYGDAASLSREIEELGLSNNGAKLLQKMVE